MPELGRVHQGRVVVVVPGIDEGAPGEKRLDDLDMTALGGNHEGRDPPRRHRVHLGAALQQGANDLHVAVPGGEQEDRPASVLVAGIRAQAEKLRHLIGLPLEGGLAELLVHRTSAAGKRTERGQGEQERNQAPLPLHPPGSPGVALRQVKHLRGSSATVSPWRRIESPSRRGARSGAGSGRARIPPPRTVRSTAPTRSRIVTTTPSSTSRTRLVASTAYGAAWTPPMPRSSRCGSTTSSTIRAPRTTRRGARPTPGVSSPRVGSAPPWASRSPISSWPRATRAHRRLPMPATWSTRIFPS